MPAGYAASLGVHESQSRLWENIVGRSREFWQWCLPHAQQRFPQLRNVSVDQIFADLNRVEPSLVRIEADEATYNLHILLRFELEKELIDGDLTCEELPRAWGDRYESYLGIRPKDDREGVMQDVHWSEGLFGYFPTYTLGNLYSAAIRDAMAQDLALRAADATAARRVLAANASSAGVAAAALWRLGELGPPSPLSAAEQAATHDSALQALAAHLAERLQIPLDAPREQPIQGGDDPELAALLDEIEGLSDEEARRLLEREDRR
jgi:hypothetical protein